MKLSFDEIEDGKQFESLVAAYFRELKDINSNVIDVTVQPSGEGSDGGRDILVTVDLTDSFATFRRIWVVQCKFHSESVGMALLSQHNIPSIIHRYGANGYLLVCKGDISSRLSDMFEGLNQKCPFRYSYVFWNGEQFKYNIRTRPNLIQTFFPDFHDYLVRERRRVEG